VYRERYCAVLLAWGQDLLVQQEWDAARQAAERVIAVDPLREEAVHLLMRVLASQGKVPGAFEQFRKFRQRLQEAMAIEPSRELRRFMEQLPHEPDKLSLPRLASQQSDTPVSPSLPSLPSGTVTFLLTDIEGSTKLWENHPEQMRTALATHDDILKVAVEQNQGHIVKTTGDGVMAAFHTANDALNTVLQAQQQLLAQEWHQPLTIRARMGLHTGTAQYRDGDYYGPSLNRAARLMAAGHGGQVLLSDVTYDLCRDALPENVSLLPLGEIER
jgi:class 3 adenylate cyclase